MRATPTVQLLGPLRMGGLLQPNGKNHGQVALRFPMDPHKARTRQGKSDEQWHIDGQHETHMSPFQLLVGVALSSQPTEDCGNLHVWPGLHHTVFEATQRTRALRGSGAAKLPRTDDKKADVEQMWLGQRPQLSDEACTQVKLEPGDVVLAHQKVPHRIGLNRSPHVRYQVYFRLAAAGFDSEGSPASVWDGWAVGGDAPAA